jgi:small subunit ribosomal protein S6
LSTHTQQYEIAIIYHPDLEVDLTKAEDRVKKILSEAKGKITKTDNWGKKKLAYPIAKNEHGVYVFYTAELEPESIAKIESNLNITDEVIRYLIVRLDPKEQAKIEAVKKDKAERAAKRAENNKDEEETSEA